MTLRRAALRRAWAGEGEGMIRRWEEVSVWAKERVERMGKGIANIVGHVRKGKCRYGGLWRAGAEVRVATAG